jgi:CBS domain-containing protein
MMKDAKEGAQSAGEVERLDVRYVHTVRSDGCVDEHAHVYCWRTHGSTALSKCEKCRDLAEMVLDPTGQSSYLVCYRRPEGPSDESPGAVQASLTTQPPLAEPSSPKSVELIGDAFPAARTPIWTLLRRTVTAVTADVCAGALGDLFADGVLTTVPVVDKNGRLLGVVSQADVLRANSSADMKSSDSTAGSLMKRARLSLRHTAPMTQAAAVLAFEAVESIPVVGQNGRFVGVLLARDVLRWFARQDGYLELDDADVAARDAHP